MLASPDRRLVESLHALDEDIDVATAPEGAFPLFRPSWPSNWEEEGERAWHPPNPLLRPLARALARRRRKRPR
jgi:hypothetical protein